MKIKIDKRLINPKLWTSDKLYLYALSSSTIGVSPKDIPEWTSHTLSILRVDSIQSPNSIEFELPDILFEFYWLVQPDRKVTISGSDSFVLLMIERRN